MSYRLKALAPCTIFVSGRSYKVEAGDRPFLSNEDGATVLTGPYSDKFIIIEHLEEEPAPAIQEQSVPGGFFSEGTLPTVPSKEDGVYVPPTETVETEGTLAADTVAPIEDIYKQNVADGEVLLNALTAAPKAKSRAKVTKDSGASVEVTDK